MGNIARDWSVYEQNQLIRYGFGEKDLDQYGEMPVEYITGHCDFDGLDFLVNRDVLIPRVETGQMLPIAEKLVFDKQRVVFAEVGAGCGAIGIALYQRLSVKGKEIHGVLSDISEGAVAVARENLERLLGNETKIEILVSDLLEGIKRPEKFDLVLANLPYIPTSRVPRLPESVVSYEPHIALDGGVEGLTLLKKLLISAKNRLASDGALILEIDYSHDIPDFIENADYQYEIVVDEFGQNRFLIARLRVI